MRTILIALLGASLALNAQQTGKEWLKKMNDRYEHAGSVQLEFEASYYATYALTQPSNTIKGKVMYTGENYYSDAMGQEIIINRKTMLIVDKTEKSITVLPGRDKGAKQDKATSAAPDSAWLAAFDIKLLNTTGATRTVVVKEKNSIYERTEITINAVTCAMEKVVYYYKAIETGGKPAFVVTYKNIRFDEKIPDVQFSDKKYIQRKGSAISPAAAWSNYRIIDLSGRSAN